MEKKWKWNRSALVLVVVVVFGFAPGVNAQCPPFGPEPLFSGPENPVIAGTNGNGFPLWIMDQTGLALQICLDTAVGNCFFDPPITGNAFSEAIGFGPEAFWWLASASLDLTGGGGAVLVMGAEAAWTAEVPNPGDQFPFTRLRIRVDTPASGTYTVTHPYGVEVFEIPNDLEAIAAGINETIDIALPAPTFGVTHVSRIGPFLQWDPAVDPQAPPGFIGDGGDPNGGAPDGHTVIGSPCGTNFFEVEIDDPAIDLDPALVGIQNSVTQDLFIVQGQIYTGTPTIVDSSTYSRNASGQVDVFARSLKGATLSVTGTTASPTPTMTDDGTGSILKPFFFHIPGLDAATLPASVTVTATTTDPRYPIDDSIVTTLDDIITIARAVYDPDLGGGTLTVVASSSDRFSPPPLTVVGLGPMVNGKFTASNLPIPPKTVTVTSDPTELKPSDTAQVIVVSHPDGVCEGDLDVDGDQDALDLDTFSIDFGRNDCP